MAKVANAQETAGVGFFASVRAAFASWWTALGVIGASVTGFNLVHGLLRLDLSQVLARAVQEYHRLVHLPVLLVLDWLQAPRPPLWLIDASTLWVLIGGVLLRTAWIVRQSALKARVMRRDSRTPAWALWYALLDTRFLLPVFILYCVVFWPLAVRHVLARPFVSRHYNGDRTTSFEISSRKLTSGRWLIPGADIGLRPSLDLRWVLSLQAAAVIACTAAWFALNAALKLYG